MYEVMCDKRFYILRNRRGKRRRSRMSNQIEYSYVGPNGAQKAQMESRRPKWSPGGPNGAQEAEMEPRRPKWSPGSPPDHPWITHNIL